MRNGKLRHRIRLEVPIKEQDSATGEDVITGYQELATVWASFEPLSARDLVAAQAAKSQITARIVTRYREGLSATMRAVHRGQVYSVHGVLPDPKSGREYVTLPVSEGVRNG
ncbi:phage head closure protein [Halopseudomonas aestusnigri]|jgi:SPP1 family predicted phage head-tail adaptor|uniref:phage head closure protein n=1 Tax=Halopseudomonas aestusnigri TaxID=857252 RepID=UPI0025564D22|nr:phage head closure protein [Halopseudomonas aestusnigri]MDL2200668.1 phage head closure protein [Halopseudomonas aestusnigri]